MNNSRKDSLFIEFSVGRNNSFFAKSARNSLFRISAEMNSAEMIWVCDAKNVKKLNLFYSYLK